MLHDGVVDRLGRCLCKPLRIESDEVALPPRLRHDLGHGSLDVRTHVGELIEVAVGPEDEHAAVPGQALRDVPFRGCRIGLLRETGERPGRRVPLDRSALAEVAISRLGSMGRHTEGDQPAAVGHLDGSTRRRNEHRCVSNQMIGRQNDQRVAAGDRVGGGGHRRSRVASDRLGDQSAGGDVDRGQLGTDDVDVLYPADDHGFGGARDGCCTGGRRLEQGTLVEECGQQLWNFASGQGPQARSGTAGEDHRDQVGHALIQPRSGTSSRKGRRSLTPEIGGSSLHLGGDALDEIVGMEERRIPEGHVVERLGHGPSLLALQHPLDALDGQR